MPESIDQTVATHHVGRDSDVAGCSSRTRTAVQVDGEKAPLPQDGAPHVEAGGMDGDQVATPPAPPIGDAASIPNDSAEASPGGTLADCAELMFLTSADDVLPSGVRATHSACTNKLMADVGEVVDLLFDGPRRPKIPRGGGFLDKMEGRAYLVADRIGHGLLPRIAPPDPSSANAIGKRAHKQVGAVAAKHCKAKAALAAAIRKERQAAAKDSSLASGVEERIAKLEKDAATAAAELDDTQYDLKLPPPITKSSRKRKAIEPPMPAVPREPTALEKAIEEHKLQKQAAAAAKKAAIIASAGMQAAARRLEKAEAALHALGDKPDEGYFVIEPALGLCSQREHAKRDREAEQFDQFEEALDEAQDAFDQAVESADEANAKLVDETLGLQSAFDAVMAAEHASKFAAIDRFCSQVSAECAQGLLQSLVEKVLG